LSATATRLRLSRSASEACSVTLGVYPAQPFA
jgi:hypothetical protein